MKKAKIVISENADFDLNEIADWYNIIDKKLIWVFLKDFKTKVKYIAENPLSCEIRYENFRIAYLKRFPFGVHYQYNEEKNLIEIYQYFTIQEILIHGNQESENPNLIIKIRIFFV